MKTFRIVTIVSGESRTQDIVTYSMYDAIRTALGNLRSTCDNCLTSVTGSVISTVT